MTNDADLAGADGGRSECPGALRRGRQHPSERPVGICTSWRCRACGASIGLDRATGAVRLDTSRAETIRARIRMASGGEPVASRRAAR